MPNRPQDHKRKKLNIGGTAVAQALSLQSANMAQKAMLDNIVAKVVAIMRVLKSEQNARKVGDEEEQPDLQLDLTIARSAIDEVMMIFQLDRHQINELTSRDDSGYPDQEIQDVLDEAVEKMVALLLDPDRLSRNAQQASDA